jgi:serine/threonine protein kinase
VKPDTLPSVSEGSPTEAFGPYIVYEQLGVGGMAQVHRAVAANDAFQRSVALKRMLSHIASSEDMVKSFVREARLASYLRHENVAQTYDLGRVDDTYFIVMELITGRNLREVLRHCGVTTGPMPVQFALNILNQVCDALDYAHNLCDETGQPLGIIHRDVSPSNVIVSETGVVKLIDFGIAKASGGGMQTMSGTLKGKFAYMAPEYIGGRIDARADLFAVGVIAHELLTNRPLFTGRDDIDTLGRVRDMRIAPPSKKNPLVPPEIDDIVMTALERDPERRWQHATALRTALTTLTKRLGLVASNAQVVQWLDWAFSQPPKQAARGASEPDTDTDTETADKTADEPSISAEQTVEHRAIKRAVIEPPSLSPSMSQKVTLVLGDSDPTPPSKPPIGTPESVPAQKSSPPTSSSEPAPPARPDVPRRHPVVPPRSVAGSAAPPMARASSTFPTRVAASSAAPPMASRVAASSAAPPMASRARSASAPPPPAVPSPAAQSLQVPPELLAQSQSAAGRPGASLASTAAEKPTPSAADSGLAPPVRTIPILGAAPAFPASRARSPSAPPPQSFQAALQNLAASSPAAAQGVHAPGVAHGAPGSAPHGPSASPAPSPASASPSSPVQAFKPASPSQPQAFTPAQASPVHGFQVSPSSQPHSFNASSVPAPPTASASATSPVLIAILVVLAAAAAAITVYFVLPLLT